MSESGLSPKQLLALSHRLAVFSAIRKVAVGVFVLFFLWALTTGVWLLIPLALVVAAAMAGTMSWYSMGKVTRLTGLSQSEQTDLWNRYKGDPGFAVAVHNDTRPEAIR
jgi:hypothetical protein